ncbi:hypothetical protein [Psychrobacter immobilis]|uniref:hypothetical protein n=1 Tax=Psychrobacter immobilis TaxID=498 RepID=UPI001D12440F|nr:hypothetical protein [Psychrobacter immobilis]
MSKLIASLTLLLITACAPATPEYDEYYGAGYIGVNEALWPTEYTTPYPFTVPYGEISCGSHPAFGREVYFEPKGYTDESYIGTPLNKSAVDSLRQSNMISNVPYSIKEGADLNEAIEVGLRVCDEYQEKLDFNNNL